jgi:hypothetical protein
VREQAGPVASDLGQEAVLAAAAEQVPYQRDAKKLGVGTVRSRAGPARNPQVAGRDRVIDQAVDVDEQQLSLLFNLRVS